MKRKNIIISLSISIFCVVAIAIPSQAATFTQRFINDYQTDNIYLFLYDDDPSMDVTFDNVRFGGSSTWQVASGSTPTYLHLEGPTADPRKVSFSVTFTDNIAGGSLPPFTLEWAEYLGTSLSAPDAFGSLSRSGNRWTASNEFNSTVPTPLPASTWLLLSGLFFLVGVRRHTRP